MTATAVPVCQRCGRPLPKLVCCCHRHPHLFPPVGHQPEPEQGPLFEDGAA